MLDTNLLKSDLENIALSLKKKGFTLDVTTFTTLLSKRRELQMATQNLQKERNHKSKVVGKLKAKQEDASAVMNALAVISEAIKKQEVQLKHIETQCDNFLLNIPNTPHHSVPEGMNELDNQVVRQVGQPTEFNFDVVDHADLLEAMHLVDFKRAAKLSGSRFSVLYGQMARLQRALIQFMIDIHVNEHGYQEIYVPYLVHETCLYGTGALPKMREDLFVTQDETPRYLIPTAEVPVTNLHRDEILLHADLPIKYVAHTPCFRSEAGSYGKDTKGIIRQHQFEKVELVQFVHPDHSYDALDDLCADAERILQRLELPYQVVNLCGGDLSFSSSKTYDIEVWLPSQKCYREISSCSNFESFQARRMQIRSREDSSEKPSLVHTINGSGLAIGRTLVAIVENYQQKDGSIRIPNALKPYMNNLDSISGRMISE